MTITCLNWWYKIAVTDFCVMPNNFSSFFCCGCEIAGMEVRKEGLKQSESVWSNRFKTPLDQFCKKSKQS
jgi:hypothetical protein